MPMKSCGKIYMGGLDEMSRNESGTLHCHSHSVMVTLASSECCMKELGQVPQMNCC